MRVKLAVGKGLSVNVREEYERRIAKLLSGDKLDKRTRYCFPSLSDRELIDFYYRLLVTVMDNSLDE